MRKIIVAGILSMTVSLFAEVDLYNKSNIDTLSLVGFYQYADNIGKVDATKWYLSRTDKALYEKIKRDEFALEEVADKYHLILMKKIDDSQSMLGGTITVKQDYIQLEKYNFKEQKFPIKTSGFATTPQRGFGGDKFSVAYYKGNWGKLTYALKVVEPDNYSKDKKFLSMKKSDAKALLNGKRSQDIKVFLKYTMTIKSIKSPVVFSASSNYKKVHMGASQLKGVELLGHIIKCDLVDANDTVLQTYDYK